MTAVTGGAASDTAGEPGRCTTFFLGSSVPTGAQTVSVDTNFGASHYGVAVTVTAGADTAVHEAGIVLLQGDGTFAEQSVTDGSPGTDSLRFAGAVAGLSTISNNPASPGANSLSRGSNSTEVVSIDTGSIVAMVVRETTAGQGARSVGFASTTSDDRAAVHLAIKEASGGGAYTLTANVGAATGAGVSGTLKRAFPLTASVGAATAAGVSATPRKGYPITGASGSATAAGVAATLRGAWKIVASGGTGTGAGVSATLQKGFLLTANVGAATGAGVAGTVFKSYPLAGSAGAATAAGLSASVLKGFLLTANSGAATGAGVAATVKWNHIIIGSAGSATAAGVAGTVRRAFPLTAAAGAATGAGVSSTLQLARKIVGSVGSATAAGQAATVRWNHIVIGAAGAATATGATATLRGAWKIIGSNGTATAAGIQADLTYTPSFNQYVLTANVGSATLSGDVAGLTYTPSATPESPTQYVGAVGRGRRRVWVEIRGGQVYEVADEQEARKVVRAIKRKAVRQIKHAEIGGPLPDLPAIEIRGEAPFVETLKREIGEIEMDMAQAYQRLFEAMDEDDVETLLL
jgi:hypothetical protein